MKRASVDIANDANRIINKTMAMYCNIFWWEHFIIIEALH